MTGVGPTNSRCPWTPHLLGTILVCVSRNSYCKNHITIFVIPYLTLIFLRILCQYDFADDSNEEFLQRTFKFGQVLRAVHKNAILGYNLPDESKVLVSENSSTIYFRFSPLSTCSIFLIWLPYAACEAEEPGNAVAP